MDKKRVYFVTNYYTENIPFFEYELKQISKENDVYLILVNGKKEKKDYICENVFFLDYSLSKTIPFALFFFFSGICYRELLSIFKEKSLIHNKIRQVFTSVRFYSSAVWFEDRVKKEIGGIKDNSIIYTFWNDFPILAFLMKKKNRFGCKYISRIHAYDLFDDRVPSGRQPFKWYINSNIDKLVFISKSGFDYYLNRYNTIDKEKCSLYPLGAEKHDLERNMGNGKEFILVSCSYLVELKRVDLIIRSLSEYVGDFPIRWVHFGGGELESSLAEMADKHLSHKHNVRYELMGNVKHETIIDYYKNNGVSCFIMVSSTEGAPVSVMEALSAGIPVIATAVGDVPRMVEGNGILLNASPSTEDVLRAITDITDKYCNRHNDNEYQNMCEMSIELFKKRYSIEYNAERFINDILKGGA